VIILARRLARRDEMPATEKRKENAPPQKNRPRTLKDILLQCGLSRREIEVAELLYSKQSSTKEIASQLNISENTVATHIKHIFEKCGVNSRISFYKLMNEKITRKGDVSTPPHSPEKAVKSPVLAIFKILRRR
ncbi:MAG: helix-turn-helix transcriptional regulator, partial [Treponemataceae bacterium]|nr:helix-turn-helix transcriptional regulator [Treponemataceae bacterium]